MCEPKSARGCHVRAAKATPARIIGKNGTSTRQASPVSGNFRNPVTIAIKVLWTRTSMGGFVALGRSGNAEFLHPELEGASFEAKSVGGPSRPGQGPTRLLQCHQDVGSFGLCQRLL